MSNHNHNRNHNHQQKKPPAPYEPQRVGRPGCLCIPPLFERKPQLMRPTVVYKKAAKTLNRMHDFFDTEYLGKLVTKFVALEELVGSGDGNLFVKMVARHPEEIFKGMDDVSRVEGGEVKSNVSLGDFICEVPVFRVTGDETHTTRLIFAVRVDRHWYWFDETIASGKVSLGEFINGPNPQPTKGQMHIALLSEEGLQSGILRLAYRFHPLGESPHAEVNVFDVVQATASPISQEVYTDNPTDELEDELVVDPLNEELHESVPLDSQTLLS